jgi:hypothetical protein
MHIRRIAAVVSMATMVIGIGCAAPTDEADGERGAQNVSGDRCYGAHGAHCDGIPGFATLQPSWQYGNVYSLPVTVGSQFHDQCCARVNAAGGRGYMCNGGNTDTTTCKNEWDRAMNDQAWGYTWRRNFDVTVVTPYSTNAQVAWHKAPPNTKLSPNDARGGWCASGQYYFINFGLQAICK